MSDLSVPEMMAQLAPGQRGVFPPTPSRKTEAERFMVVTRNYNRDASPNATDLEWIDPTSMPDHPTTGGIQGKRVALSELPTIRARLSGKREDVLDYYGFDSEIFVVSERLKSLFESLDPDAIEFAQISIASVETGFPRYFAALPKRVLWAIDTALTQVTVYNQEFLPGRFTYRVYYESNVYIRPDISDEVHFFKDFGSPAFFWSKILVEMAVKAGIEGLQAESPSGSADVKPVYL